MESLAYLPRCDLGIVLVDASSTLVQEDTFVVNALRQAGAEVMVLLTKADVLAPGDRTAAAQYIADQLRANLGFEVPVHVVSVKGADAELCDRWFETALFPCLREHRKLAGASLRRKVGLLRDATLAVLQRRLDRRSAAGGDLAEKWADVESASGDALAKLETAQRQQTEWPDLSEKVLDAAAHEIVDEWRRNGPPTVDAAANVVSGGNKQAGRLAAEIAGSLELLRESLKGVLQDAAAATGSPREEAADLPVPTGMPVLDLAGNLPETALYRPWWVHMPGGMAFRSTRELLTRRLGPRLTSQMKQYTMQLERWRSEMLAQLRRSFTAKVDFCRAQCEPTSGSSDPAAIERDLKRLHALQGDD
jgi:hypothetical protein